MAPTSDFELSDPVKSAIEQLQDNFGFECGRVLGKGTYGSVLKVTNHDEVPLAAKIVERRMLNDLEVIIWPKLQHENVLKLLDTICDIDGVIIFITELMATNLFVRLQDRDFKSDPRALDRCRTYAKQALSGIAYLHKHKLCHLDLRAENIFLSSEDDRAVVADFSGLSWVETEKRFCPLPQSLRPPELLVSKKRVSPLPVDLWSCGLLIANLFLGKGFYMCTVRNTHAGQIEAVQQYTDLFQSEVYVRKFLKETYALCTPSSSTVRGLIIIISRFLQLNPKNRMKAEDSLSHPFLVTKTIVREKENDCSNDPKYELPLVVEDGLEKSLNGAVGNSEKFTVSLFKLSDQKMESNLIAKAIISKSAKISRWSKYKKRLSSLKNSFRSAPLLKNITFKKKDKRKLKVAVNLKKVTLVAQ